MKHKLILLHGALGSKSQFSVITEILSEKFDVSTINFSGHASNVSDSEYSIELFTEDVLDNLPKDTKSKVNIFGFSMGGYVALSFASKFPNHVNKIMTLGTKFNWSPESAEKEIANLNPDKIELKVQKFAQMLEERHSPQNWIDVVNKTARFLKRLGSGEALDFKKIKLPHNILITRGEKDNMVTAEESLDVVKSFLNAQYYEFEDMKHPIEQADANYLSSKIIEFFDDCDI